MFALFVYVTLSTSGSDMSPLILKFRISAESYTVYAGQGLIAQLKKLFGSDRIRFQNLVDIRPVNLDLRHTERDI